MTVYLSDVLNVTKLYEEEKKGYVSIRRHEEFPELRIANYTPKAVYARHWNNITRKTRGLIWDNWSGELLARPFEKFFNYNEPDAPDFDWDAPILYADNKEDGSLAIPYVAPDGSVRFATRGSFHSEQAKLATSLLTGEIAEELKDTFEAGLTDLYEIVGPDNRIVLKYEKNELRYLNSVDMEHGNVMGSLDSGPTFREILARPPRENAEGWVVWLDNKTAVKVKQEDYLALHRAVTGLTKKEVWRQACAGTYVEFLTNLPEEFRPEVEQWHGEMVTEVLDLDFRAIKMYAGLKESGLIERRDQALWINSTVEKELRPVLFKMLNGQDYNSVLWKLVEPKQTEVES